MFRQSICRFRGIAKEFAVGVEEAPWGYEIVLRDPRYRPAPNRDA